jgi:hypothetical protein
LFCADVLIFKPPEKQKSRISIAEAATWRIAESFRTHPHSLNGTQQHAPHIAGMKPISICRLYPNLESPSITHQSTHGEYFGHKAPGSPRHWVHPASATFEIKPVPSSACEQRGNPF